jgi:hypothetical protein
MCLLSKLIKKQHKMFNQTGQTDNVKLALYRPKQAPWAPGGWDAHDFLRISAWRWHCCHLPCISRLYLRGKIPGTYFCQRLSRPQGHSVAKGLSQWRVSKTPLRIGPTTFWLVVQKLDNKKLQKLTFWHKTEGGCRHQTEDLSSEFLTSKITATYGRKGKFYCPMVVCLKLKRYLTCTKQISCMTEYLTL